MDTLRYDNEGVWDATPDEGEYSLAYIVNATDNNDPRNWAVQKVFVTPRAENEFCSPITNNSIIADISCYGANDGFITTQISGGTPPFSYSWDNGASTSIITDLSAGNYSQYYQVALLQLTKPFIKLIMAGQLLQMLAVECHHILTIGQMEQTQLLLII